MITMQLSLMIFISGGPNYTFHNTVKVKTNGSERTSFSPFCNSAANCSTISSFTVSQRKSRCFLNRLSRCIQCLGEGEKKISIQICPYEERETLLHSPSSPNLSTPIYIQSVVSYDSIVIIFLPRIEEIRKYLEVPPKKEEPLNNINTSIAFYFNCSREVIFWNIIVKYSAQSTFNNFTEGKGRARVNSQHTLPGRSGENLCHFLISLTQFFLKVYNVTLFTSYCELNRALPQQKGSLQ